MRFPDIRPTLAPLHGSAVLAAAILAVWLASPAAAQQVTVGAPMVGVHNGFSENIGVGFGFRMPGGSFFHNGGPTNLAGGSGLRIGGPNGFLNIVADQGSTRGMSMVAPSVTVMNGATGSIADVTWRPFVVGYTPIVGGLADPAFSHFGPAPMFWTTGPTALEERLSRWDPQADFTTNSTDSTDTSSSSRAGSAPALESTANHGDISVAEIRRRQAQEDAAAREQVETLIRQAEHAAEAGKPGLARIYYRQALGRAPESERAAIEQAIRSLGNSPSSL